MVVLFLWPLGYLYIQVWSLALLLKYSSFPFFNFRFPLHDKERLEKWLKNMKRDSWVPSKYQFLCSDHFTPDSLDIRWGIRYLKHTAIPTIFSLPEDNQVLEAGSRGEGANADCRVADSQEEGRRVKNNCWENTYLITNVYFY